MLFSAVKMLMNSVEYYFIWLKCNPDINSRIVHISEKHTNNEIFADYFGKTFGLLKPLRDPEKNQSSGLIKNQIYKISV